LAGLVSSEADKRQLEELAHTLVGVREVDATQLHTEEPAICVLQAGETLWELAERFYGDARLWTVIRDANAQWRDPRRIPAGTQLVVPSGEMGAVQETKDERGEG
jgi:nucleoid-associated protein YgaU